MAFTDSSIVAGTTIIKAVHLNELRARIDAVRARQGLGTFAYTYAITDGTSLVHAVDITEMHTALSQAYVSALMSGPT